MRKIFRDLLLAFFAVALPGLAVAMPCDQDSLEIITTPIIEQSPLRLVLAKKFYSETGDRNVLIIGDSIAARWSKTQALDFAGFTVANMGLHGERIQELRWRLRTIPPKVKPSRIILIIGTNNLSDKGTPGCAISGGVSSVIEDIDQQWPDARLYIVPILPRGQAFRFRQEDRRAINLHIRETIKSATVVAIDEEKLTCNSSGDCPNYTPDKLHLNDSGYAILREALSAAGF
ncbi:MULTISPECIES: GDSL-type esterase/lipase family protein [unclassified Rhizobium]|uniref:GDSL-type esterase/lipase family protein n=1 Tax=unclassified Rhizobium TaxID=2613769 RepID=UPI000700BDAF|nr:MULTISPECIES: GDSL-type esterase/lipase family protein [unclassified Rhizobium]KQV36448.1 hypothetical protein ASC86_24745 [Rhizobium sp. Root1212]KRD26738.1 hypothetical protein ASE37_24660 [Rhizobium sp. Root268]